MKIRQAEWKDIKLDAELIYCKKYEDGETIIIKGFSPLFKTPYNQVGMHYNTLCVVQKEDGEVLLVLEEQLFVKVH